MIPPSRERVAAVWDGSDGAVTKALYIELTMLGAAGEIAVNLFRANKTSTRAKKYRRRSSTAAAYDTKGWAVGNLVRLLIANGEPLGIRWGWREDPKQTFHRWVLYLDLPTGQVSFHNAERDAGPDYPAEWDGQHASADRIITWCAHLLDGTTPAPGRAPVTPDRRKPRPAIEPPGDDEPLLPF